MFFLRWWHHFRCGYVGREEEFQKGTSLICPKCSHLLEHVGKDFERPSEVFSCLDCNWSGSEPVTAGRCIACDILIENENYIIRDIKSYIIAEEGIAALKTGEIIDRKAPEEKIPSRKQIKSHFSDIVSLLALANVLGAISERYNSDFSAVCIFPDAILKIISPDIEDLRKITNNKSGRSTLAGGTVAEQKAFKLTKAILEKIKAMIRET